MCACFCCDIIRAFSIVEELSVHFFVAFFYISRLFCIAIQLDNTKDF